MEITVDFPKIFVRLTPMKATIKLSSDEINNIIRQHLYRVKGIQKITEFAPVLPYDRQDETHSFDGIEVTVELDDSTVGSSTPPLR